MHRNARQHRLFSTALAAACVCLAIFAGRAASAHGSTSLSINGVVSCSSGVVQGVWVQSSAGGSRFAAWKAFDSSASAATFSTTLPAQSSVIQLRIGCGRKVLSTGAWDTTNQTPTLSVAAGGHVVNAFSCGAGKCTFPAVGTKASRNLGAAGYCTEGALNSWRGYTGFWPQWSGNADAWSTTAAQNRWTVTPIASADSIVVIPAGPKSSSVGHVAWVNSLSQSSKGAITLNVTEENYDGTATRGTGHVRTHSYPADPSYRYIVAPDH